MDTDLAIRKATPADAPTILSLICALADYEKLPPPDEAAQARLIADAFAERPRFDVFPATWGYCRVLSKPIFNV